MSGHSVCFKCAFASSSVFGLSVRNAQTLRTVPPPLRQVQRTRRAAVPVFASGMTPTPEEEPPRRGKAAIASEFATLYGGSYLGTSMAMAAVSYSLWYVAVQAGVDVVALVQSLGDWLATTPLGRPAILSRVNETVGTAALAYIAHKASSPLRFPLTIAATPFVARAFSRKEEDSAKGEE